MAEVKPDPVFRDFNEFVSERLRLPLNGKWYEIPKPGIADALLIQRAIEEDSEALEQLYQGTRFHQAILGSAYQEMLADNADADFVARCALTAMADLQYGRIAAFRCWEEGRDPKAMVDHMLGTLAIAQTP
jgi:hypothetical protein